VSDNGTIFKITPGGVLTTLYRFDGADGAFPSAPLIQFNGTFYGTTYYGGATNEGTAFKITPGGTLAILHCFDGTDGSTPFAGLVRATNGNFYGTTEIGGTNGKGTVFKMTPSGTLTMLHSFCSQDGCPDGALPYEGLIQANGILYGTTIDGGTYGGGTIFTQSLN
jgi:uncharacterized repeat protein (TIGR03803 family)